jgi:hypothetical protein
MQQGLSYLWKFCRVARHNLGTATLWLTDVVNKGLFNFVVCVYVSSSSFPHLTNKCSHKRTFN